MAVSSSRQGRHGTLAIAAGAACVAAIVAMSSTAPEAHKAITSKYTYNKDVFPIFKERCSRCHYEGGPTLMSLMTYESAVPWAESIREQLVARKMPPWYADPRGPAVKGGHTITTKELDILVTWAVGGAPQGAPDSVAPPFSPPVSQWKAGKPDLAVSMEAPVTVPAGTTQETKQLVLPTGLKEDKWVSAVDLMPGEPSMVRAAAISIENGPVLAAWVPGHDVTPAPSGTAFKLPAGSKLHVEMFYRKHWEDEQEDKSDKSTIGLYFTDPPVSGRSLQALQLDGPQAEGGESPEPRVFGQTLKTASRVVAVRPAFDQQYGAVSVDAVAPNGRKVPILKLLKAQPQWYRRYWLAEPVELPAGTRFEVTATPEADEFATAVQKRYPLSVGIDYVPQ